MTMKTRKKPLTMLCLTALSGLLGSVSVSQAATLVNEGHAAGAQCGSTGVNNNGVVVGGCTVGSGTGPMTAFVSTSLGTETPLSPLVAGQSCSPGGIANSGTIIGSCSNGSNVGFAVTWNASTPTSAPMVLNPFPAGLLGLLLPHVSSAATGFNQLGSVIGESENSNGDGTAVIWPAGSSTATPVSSLDDNCVPLDVNNTLINSLPSVALTCPNQNSNAKGTVTAKIAQATGLLGGYVATALPIPVGYEYCTVHEINDAVNAVGACHTTAPDHPVTAFWSSPGSTPILLTTLSGNPFNAGIHINNPVAPNLVQVTFSYQMANAKHGAGVWTPSTGAVSIIPPFAPNLSIAPAGLADNGLVIVVGENSAEHTQGGTWTPSTGTVATGMLAGGQNNALVQVSRNGLYAVGEAEDSSSTGDAVYTTLP